MKRIATYLFLISAVVLFVGNPNVTVAGESVTKTNANVTPVNLAAEIARGKTEDKLLFIEFGSSDSCPPCIELEKDVFSKAKFLAYARPNLVFVRLDFPFKAKLPADVEATNALLETQFEVQAYPTFVALDREGKEFWRMPAKNDPDPGIPAKIFNPKGFIQLLEGLRKKQP